MVEFVRADEAIVVAVAVHVAGRPHRGAEPAAGLAGVRDPIGGAGQSARRPEVDERPALVALLTVADEGCPHDDIVVAVAVHVAGGRHRAAEPGPGPVPFPRP